MRETARDQHTADDALRAGHRLRRQQRCPLPGPDDAPHAVRPRQAVGQPLGVEVPRPRQRVPDRDQVGRREDGRQVEPRLRTAGDRQPLLPGQVRGQQVAHVHPQPPPPRTVGARRQADLERPVVPDGCTQEPRGGPVREGSASGQDRQDGAARGVQGQGDRPRDVGAPGDPDAVVPELRAGQPGLAALLPGVDGCQFVGHPATLRAPAAAVVAASTSVDGVAPGGHRPPSEQLLPL